MAPARAVIVSAHGMFMVVAIMAVVGGAIMAALGDVIMAVVGGAVMAVAGGPSWLGSWHNTVVIRLSKL